MKRGLATSPASAEPASERVVDWRGRFASAWHYAATLASRTWSSLPIARMLSGAGDSSSVDIDTIADRLAVNSSGLDDGRNERPRTEDDALSGTQTEIVRHFREMQVKARDRLARLHQQAAKAADAIYIDGAASRLTDIPSRCRNEAFRIKAEFQPRIDRLVERKAQQHRYYLAYREKHQLDRIAKERYAPVVSIGAIAALIALTTMVLSGLSSTAAAGSHLPGLGWAMGIGIIAIVLPFAVGANMLRFVNHNDLLTNALAWLIALLTVVGIAGMVYVSTYYLEHTAIVAESTIFGTLMAMSNDPWSPVANFSAWQRTGLVGAASLAALFVGYCADDPYPGYGEVQRAY
ncbi:MAG: hypothetical protein HKN35_06155, partial [Woeseia sp.]|nr:hypothetical protein [Woeseia sp.]